MLAEYEREQNAYTKLLKGQFEQELVDPGDKFTKKSTLELLNSYKVNTYEMPKKMPRP